MLIANNAWLLTLTRLDLDTLWSVVFQAYPFHYTSEYKVGLHFLTCWRHSKHLFILGLKFLMHFRAEPSETLQHQHRNVIHFGTKHLVPKCLGSEVSVQRWGVDCISTGFTDDSCKVWFAHVRETSIELHESSEVNVITLSSVHCFYKAGARYSTNLAPLKCWGVEIMHFD